MLNESNTSKAYEDENIYISNLLRLIIRNRKNIGFFAIVTFILSIFYAFLKPPTWEGHFQIVLESKSKSSNVNLQLQELAANNPVLQNLGLTGLAGGLSEDSILTEVKILESPSVLRPIYEYVKEQKKLDGHNTKKMNYKDWIKDDVTIDLEMGTSVLNIFYKDTDKELILDVVNKISDAYQQYSGKDRERNLIQGIDYLEEQVSKLKAEANKSLRESQSYALDNALGLNERNFNTFFGGELNSVPNKPNSIDGERLDTLNKIKELKTLIKSLKESDKKTTYLYDSLIAGEEQQLSLNLKELKRQLTVKEALLKGEHISIRVLRSKIKSLTNLIHKKTVEALEGKLLSLEAKLESLIRPRDVILNDRELKNKALRDETALKSLENSLQVMQLERAKQEDPWELITTPYIFDKPIWPIKSIVLFLGILTGIILGLVYSIIKEIIADIVFDKEELERLIPYSYLLDFDKSNENNLEKNVELIYTNLARKVDKESLALIKLGKLSSSKEKAIEKILKKYNSDNFKIIDDPTQISLYKKQILLIELGKPTRQEISSFLNKLKLIENDISGWILVT